MAEIKDKLKDLDEVLFHLHTIASEYYGKYCEEKKECIRLNNELNTANARLEKFDKENVDFRQKLELLCGMEDELNQKIADAQIALDRVTTKETEAKAKEEKLNTKEQELNTKEQELNTKEQQLNTKEQELNTKERQLNNQDVAERYKIDNFEVYKNRAETLPREVDRLKGQQQDRRQETVPLKNNNRDIPTDTDNKIDPEINSYSRPSENQKNSHPCNSHKKTLSKPNED